MDLNFNGRVNEFYNGNEWEVNLEMKMGTLIGNEFEKRFDYNEWIMGYRKFNFDNEKRV